MDLQLQVSSEPSEKYLVISDKLSKSKLNLARDLPSCDPALASIFRTASSYVCTSEISIFKLEMQPGEHFVNFSLTPSTVWVYIHTIERRII